MPATVDVVEFRLGDRVIDVDGREPQGADPCHVMQSVDAGGGFLCHPVEVGRDGPPVDVGGGTQLVENDAVLAGVALGALRHVASEFGALVDEQGRITAIVEDHRRQLTAGPPEDLGGGPPVLLQGLALPGEDRDTGCCDRCCRVILGREDVAGRPPHLGPQRDQRLDQHRSLHGHVQGARDPRTGQRLGRRVPLTHRHQPGHLVLGKRDLTTAEVGQSDVCDAVVHGRQPTRRPGTHRTRWTLDRAPPPAPPHGSWPRTGRAGAA